MSRSASRTPVIAEGFPFDPLVAGLAVFLLLYGLVMVGSASMEVGARTYDNTF